MLVCVLVIGVSFSCWIGCGGCCGLGASDGSRVCFQRAVAIGARVWGARSAAWNVTVSWVPSQNGFALELPQRQRKIVVSSARSYSFLSPSMTLAGPSIMYGPLSVAVIVTVVMGFSW